MRKKSKKYIKGSVFAALLLAAISVRTVAGAGSVNSGGLLEVGEAVQEEDKETTHGYLGETDVAGVEGPYIPENGRAGEGSEDVSSDFTDPEFLAEVKKAAGINEDGPLTEADCAKVTRLDINGKGIGSLDGFVHLTERTSLDCSNNW